jgi:hypothetical protein
LLTALGKSGSLAVGFIIEQSFSVGSKRAGSPEFFQMTYHLIVASVFNFTQISVCLDFQEVYLSQLAIIFFA